MAASTALYGLLSTGRQRIPPQMNDLELARPTPLRDQMIQKQSNRYYAFIRSTAPSRRRRCPPRSTPLRSVMLSMKSMSEVPTGEVPAKGGRVPSPSAPVTQATQSCSCDWNPARIATDRRECTVVADFISSTSLSVQR